MTIQTGRQAMPALQLLDAPSLFPFLDIRFVIVITVEVILISVLIMIPE